MTPSFDCPDCQASGPSLSRRDFVKTAGVVTAASVAYLNSPLAAGTKPEAPKSENLVEKLYAALSDEQKQEICHPWDFATKDGPLRLHVSNNWQISQPKVAGGFFTKDQQELIEALYWGLYNPEWIDRVKKQLRDDAGGYGRQQSIAIFGEPGSGKFEFVMTGRHLTIRCDGDSTEHFAFGGPIFYGHAAQGFNEKPDHPGNVYWPLALKANELYPMLDGKQQKLALVEKPPAESAVHFQGKDGKFPGIPVSELSSDQQAHVESVLRSLLEPYRESDRNEAMNCLAAQGGLEKCSLAFFKEQDLGNDGVWDVWRLEGPAFVWHFRGEPHVHVWVNIAADPSVKISTRG
ncbi:MAG: DUF3500 domain-containing protein [Planctomycetales bacterium]